ncbi:DUF4118 domain-containing protein [Streptosporangiaceae bacterium NEAU-GS5]|nr:DUF4118 domain-containing protein [Streptosporangiaceae bacterium NEAU-GS5]
MAVLGMPALAAILGPFREALSLSSQILLFLLLVVGVALVGGTPPAITAAVGGFLLLNWFFTPPLHTLIIGAPQNVLGLVAFVLVAVAVSAIVDLAARRTREAARAGAAAEVLSLLAGAVLRGEAAMPTLLGRLREAFGLTSVTLLERDGGEWRIIATAGGPPFSSPQAADDTVVVDDSLVVALRGRPLEAADRSVVEAFAAQVVVALRQRRLAEEAERAGPLEEADRMRTALLAAVSHDLRTPLASAKAAVESLRGEIDWSPEDRGELLATADESLAKLARLVANLLDMSRLQAGTLGLKLQPVALTEILPRAVEDHDVIEELPDTLPDVVADPALLERILANLVSNAVRYSPGKVWITAGVVGGRVEIRVVDRGQGIPAEAYDRVFLPFQRLGDRDNHTGVGLGLALSRGLAEAMAGTLVPEETPGGGLTMVLTLPERGVGSEGREGR